MKTGGIVFLLTCLALGLGARAGRAGQAPADEGYFTATLPLDAMTGKQAVMETTRGTIVLQLLPEHAPMHVAHFIEMAQSGQYEGTIFHNVVAQGIIQGGDPISKDPDRTAEYGSGGLNRLRDEARTEPHLAGSVSTVTLPGQPDSGGMQFIICVGDQPGLDGQFTVFARVVEGLEVVEAISELPANADGLPNERVAITSITIRDTPPEPFTTETDAELADFRVVLETTMGSIELEMRPDLAPVTVRRFLQWVAAGIYDGMLVFRVAPDFVIQTGAAFHRSEPLLASQQALIEPLPPEFTDTPNEPGTVSIARDTDPNSGSTSFFICTGACTALTGQYTVFARVSGGQDVVDAIAGVPVEGERPLTPIEITRAYAEHR